MKTKKDLSPFFGIRRLIAAAALLVWISLGTGAAAQSSNADRPASTVSPVVPQQVRYAGVLTDRAGQTVEAVFRVYAEAEGGEPLWTETQQLSVGANGGYAVLLGSVSAQGIPQSVFASGQARWLGVSVEGAPEQQRALLASVPYAMKSADAEALAGRPAADFVTQDQLAQLAAPTRQNAAQPAVVTPEVLSAVTGSGTTNVVPLWSSSTTLGNSMITQGTSGIGVNNSTPATTLDVGGAATFRGTVNLVPTIPATSTFATNSHPLELSASAWSSTATAPVSQNFALTALGTGNNTATPSGELLLEFASGTSALASTGLSFASNGLITFASGQTFPGTGTITHVLGQSPLIGGGTTGTVTLGLSFSELEATLNGFYARVGTSNTFAGNQAITGGLTVTGALAAASSAVTGLSSAAGGFLSNGAVTLKPAGAATSTAGLNSPLLELGASAYSSTSSSAAAQNFAWQTMASGNDTASPTANLSLLFGAGTTAPAATGLSIAPNGTITFSPSQTFPITGTGGGTITGITTASPLTGSGTSGSVALGLNTSALLTAISPSLITGITTASPLTGSGTSGSVALGLNTSALLSAISPSLITGITTNSPLTGGGTSGSVALGLDTGALTTTIAPLLLPSLNGVYAQLGTGNTFTAGQTIQGVSSVTGTNVSGSMLTVTNTGDSSSTAITAGNGGQYGTGIYSSAGADGYGIEGFGTQTGGSIGVLGSLSSSTGLSNSFYSLESDDGLDAGVWADGPDGQEAALIATADNDYAGIFYNDSATSSTILVLNNNSGGTTGLAVPGIGTVLRAGGPGGTCGINQSGSIACTGQMKALATTSDGARQVETYSVQSSENWVEDYGSGQLSNGSATIALDPAFAEIVNVGVDFHVFLTPGDDCKGLYVTHKTASGFEVHELGGGTANISFDYKIVAKRRGLETQRLVDVTARMKTESEAAQFKPLAHPLENRGRVGPGRTAKGLKTIGSVKP
ncbi:MAG: hypothetical protein ABSC48_16200 [Terracidiphilus sp.]|jgi:hypothetical protein